MSFTELCKPIFVQSINDYHKTDNVDTPINNPYEVKSIEYYLYLKNWIDTVQWHFEDIIRDPQIDPVEALALKRRIDKSNQDRTDLVELIEYSPMQRLTPKVLHGPSTGFLSLH